MPIQIGSSSHTFGQKCTCVITILSGTTRSRIYHSLFGTSKMTSTSQNGNVPAPITVNEKMWDRTIRGSYIITTNRYFNKPDDNCFDGDLVMVVSKVRALIDTNNKMCAAFEIQWRYQRAAYMASIAQANTLGCEIDEYIPLLW